MNSTKKLPNNFIFAASTCAFQIEGARNLQGRTDSIWDEFTKRNFFIPDINQPAREIASISEAADFYHKYPTDARIMEKLGLNGLVYNMDWTRIMSKNETEINPEGIKFYDNLFKTLNTANVKPIPILFHWDTPLWAEIKGGWENREIIEWFRIYVRNAFKYLGKYSDIWFVNDENSTFTLSGYLSDYLPPAKNDKLAFVKALHHLHLSAAVTKEEFIKAKAKGYLSENALLGIDHDWSPSIAFRPDNIEDQQAAKLYDQWFKNLFLDPNLNGTYPEVFTQWIKTNNLDFTIGNEDLNYLKQYRLDLIGWNYYRPCYIATGNIDEKKFAWQKPSEVTFTNDFKIVYPKDNVEYTKWNWIVNPQHLSLGAKILDQEYNLPIMIVENGYGDFDQKENNNMIKDVLRINYLQSHINQVKIAVENNVNLIGYSLWTYCDIFSPSGGYRKNYGLVSVDFNSPIKKRTPKLSYVWYRNVIKNRASDLSIDQSDLEQQLQTLLEKWDLWLQ